MHVLDLDVKEGQPLKKIGKISYKSKVIDNKTRVMYELLDA